MRKIWLALAVASLLTACHSNQNPAVSNSTSVDLTPPHQRLLTQLRDNTEVLPPKLERVELFSMYNREAPVPPQCYTRTEGKHNPCYVCHQNQISGRENVMNDGDQQIAYNFSDIGVTNHWQNLFEDRSARVAQISDDEIRQWIVQDNYTALAPRLRAKNFSGWIPDLTNLAQPALAFDEQGLARDGSGWVTFNYKPLPSTFWPTNGSTDDVMIRLPTGFRNAADGQFSRDVYFANLALVEANIKQVSIIDTLSLDERRIGADLDGDGRLGIARSVRRGSHYVGAAKHVAIVEGIYPLDTEFLHTVRYVGVGANGEIYNAPRMKEVRYMRRWLESTPAQLKVWYEAEHAEKDKGELPAYINLGQRGLGTPMGWQIAGFIEDKHGELRFNTFEENMFCMGCHNSIGSTIDKTFSFARKIDGARGWGYIDLHGMVDAPNRGESLGEIATYLERVGGGSEFRNNDEMQAKFYRADGSLNRDAVIVAGDVYGLITPSPQRALELNKAYKAIVEKQDFLFGRDATIAPPKNVYDRVDTETAPTLPTSRQYSWDIRLDWGRARADVLSVGNDEPVFQ